MKKRCSQCGRSCPSDIKSRHGLEICIVCKMKDNKMLVEDNRILFELSKFFSYLRQTDQITLSFFSEFHTLYVMYGTDGCDVEYILNSCYESSPENLKEYFQNFMELVK